MFSLISIINASKYSTNRLFKRVLAVLLLLLIILLFFISIERINFVHRLSKEIHSKNYDPQWDDFAFAVKTGSEVALERVPIQLITFLADVRNKIIIGNGPNVTIGDYEVIDVYTNLYNDSAHTLHKRSPTTEELFPNNDSEGWKSDAHKNLPGFKELYTRYPHAKWYIMIDDDTYVLRHNLANFLSKYDHTKNLYFGNPADFTGCDGITKYGDGPTFAHGGSGIVLSNGALKTILSKLDTCIERYRNCFAGDVRTALCLRDHGIMIKGVPGFNISPPHTASTGGPCQRPYTYHHLLVHQIQDMWNIESQLQFLDKKFMRNSDILSMLIGKKEGEELMADVNMPGRDINHFNSPDALSCQTSCRKEAKCISFSYSNGVCWLKDARLQSNKQNGTVSGFLREKYVCKTQRSWSSTSYVFFFCFIFLILFVCGLKLIMELRLYGSRLIMSDRAHL